ncbi:hypothetical protein U1Q18_048217 [Sarracenia purpurea var. burkii]
MSSAGEDEEVGESGSDGEDESDEDAGVCSEVVKEEGNSESPCPLVCERKNKFVAVTTTEVACSNAILSSSGDDEDGGDTGMDGEEASEDDAGVGEDEDEAGEEQGSAPLPLFQERNDRGLPNYVDIASGDASKAFAHALQEKVLLIFLCHSVWHSVSA